MLDVITDWAKNICLALILISILEMLLPNNKTKKYVKMVMGIYLLFNIISPIISNQETFSLSNFDINDYTNNVEMQTSSENVNQSSMDKRIQEIYLEELEKDITNKLENKGYKVNKCAIKGSFENNEGIKQFKKIKLKLFNSISKYQSFIMYIGRPTCPDCRSFENDFKLKLNKKSPHHLYYLNVEKLHQNQNRWSKFKKSNNIEGTPAFVYYKNGKLISSSSWTVKKGYSTRMAYKWLKKFY